MTRFRTHYLTSLSVSLEFIQEINKPIAYKSEVVERSVKIKELVQDCIYENGGFQTFKQMMPQFSKCRDAILSVFRSRTEPAKKEEFIVQMITYLINERMSDYIFEVLYIEDVSRKLASNLKQHDTSDAGSLNRKEVQNSKDLAHLQFLTLCSWRVLEKTRSCWQK